MVKSNLYTHFSSYFLSHSLSSGSKQNHLISLCHHFHTHTCTLCTVTQTPTRAYTHNDADLHTYISYVDNIYYIYIYKCDTHDWVEESGKDHIDSFGPGVFQIFFYPTLVLKVKKYLPSLFKAIERKALQIKI